MTLFLNNQSKTNKIVYHSPVEVMIATVTKEYHSTVQANHNIVQYSPHPNNMSTMGGIGDCVVLIYLMEKIPTGNQPLR